MSAEEEKDEEAVPVDLEEAGVLEADVGARLLVIIIIRNMNLVI